jgi:hypothetical protein
MGIELRAGYGEKLEAVRERGLPLGKGQLFLVVTTGRKPATHHVD